MFQSIVRVNDQEMKNKKRGQTRINFKEVTMNNFKLVFVILISLFITGCASGPSNVPYLRD